MAPTPNWLRRRGAKPEPQNDALWEMCPSCGERLYKKDLAERLWICSRCGHHFRLHALDRIALLADGDFHELAPLLATGDPLTWSDRMPYANKIAGDRQKSGLLEAVVVGLCTIEGVRTGLGVMDFFFRGGTMGSVVGEKVTLLIEECARQRLPVVLVTASGGARMEEGVIALMQLAKTTAAAERFSALGLPLITVLTDPTTGGVSASFGFQGDVIIAETGAAIGFAGRRVIDQTIRQKLPEGFQSAEFLLEHGQVDMVVRRTELKGALGRLLHFLTDKAVPA
ncbi:MAG: acetyl-CoA carboxylase, carboxyltransferase subunit beta [Candidatus Eremiobacteraeota bacterium]|nr:acetyl-CoA carboxylase, carboxyltransferase subunit beta [Candidatus Eremiobacteraeota bacterium]MBV8203540.1 acetyl-CoA carboxylase, carboxyltransferase subunit beta [Candidatus Eremiobacteraeota bacterium]MBV8460997.1 acetyl-CoA carboxylase, carboxyltransferase subunit beta [Candidatus Eremiobacteraeota bacterium]MBV8596646.1 acetyl-CoA carboxylase, carboxyltransferase subunit beta [Candidatus Eremiobacteraeota bacterium]MBV8669324.1 acetyl-CoA carboxylase, carboxyltransferase subunit beta